MSKDINTKNNPLKSAAKSLNEAERLAVLHDTCLLDSPHEDAFDAITSITAQLCEAPISIICLVDAERVWIKSVRGLSGVSEIPRAQGFCPHTINQNGIFEIGDATKDERFHDNPLVISEPYFKYYAGTPLITRDGYALGTLCILDYQPNKLSAEKKIYLEDMAKVVTELIEARRTKETKRLSLEHRLGDIAELSANEIYLVNEQTERFVYANRSAQRALGYSLNELKLLKWHNIIESTSPPSSSADINNYNLSTLALNSEAQEFSHRRKDGSTYPVESIFQSCFLENDEFLVMSNDISQRKQSEEALQNSETRYRELFQNAPDAILIHDPEKQIFLDCNRVAEQLLGYSREELLALGPKDITPEFQPNGMRTVDLVRNVDRDVQGKGNTIRVEHSFLNKNGEEIPCQVTVTRHPISERFVTVATVSDIRKRKEAEEREKTLIGELAHMTRINTLGALASGLSHELNQPLTAIAQYCDTAISLIDVGATEEKLVSESINNAHSQAMRAAEIIRRVRSFAGNRQPTRSTIDVKELLNETIQLLNQDIHKQNIELNIEIDENLPLIHADRVQLQQVLLNLIRNSIEAMEKNGSIKQLTVNCIRHNTDEVEFSVTDTGPGIKHNLLDNLITPRESNKPDGMGMGLCISNSIVNAHDGTMWNDSNYKDGACIRFRIPA